MHPQKTIVQLQNFLIQSQFADFECDPADIPSEMALKVK